MVLPKSMRIKGYKCFNYIHKTAYKFNTPLILLKVAEANPRLLKDPNQAESSQNLRFAISISNKVSKKAVLRNKLRRALHEHLKSRFQNKSLLQRKWLLLSLKPGSMNQSLFSLKRDLDKLLSKAGF